MIICTTHQMQQAERALIESGRSPLSLMNEAAERIAQAITVMFPSEGTCIAYLGKGNNAGDALAVARLLRAAGWKIALRCAYETSAWGDLPKHQLEQLEQSGASRDLFLSSPPQMPGQPGEVVLLLDGLLGLGAKLPLAPEISRLCREMNDLRLSSGKVRTWAIDLPTGIDGDTGAYQDDDIVVADYTSVIGAGKRGLFHDGATVKVGRIVPIALPGLSFTEADNSFVLESRLFTRLLRPRPYDMHKGQAGHVAVIAGSIGMLGAAKLCSEAALKAGAGLVTLYCLQSFYPVLAGMVAPEIIVKPVVSYDECKIDDYDALLIGPGLGSMTKQSSVALGLILRNFDGPVVLDADGLKLVASEKLYLGENVLATPHPGEMTRFLPQALQESSRADIVEYFKGKHGAALIYKGARSIISQGDSPLYYNVTGGPSMATAGQGDVLAGVCAGLCAQKVSPLMAGCMGAYLCGLASEIAISNGSQTEKTLTAGDTLRAIPLAMRAISQGII